MRSVVWLTVSLLSLASPAVWAVGPVDQLLEGPAACLLTTDERAEAEAIGDPAEAARFVALFWARRDPDPSTPVNEFREDFQARVRAADAQFGEGPTRGAVTDRGRVLILLGMPAERRVGSVADYLDALYNDLRRRNEDGTERNTRIGEAQDVERMLTASKGPVGRRGDFQDVAPDAKFRDEADPSSLTVSHGVRFDPVKAVTDVWVYRREHLPGHLGLPAEVEVAFFDRIGDGHYELQTTIRGAERIPAILEAAAAATVADPALETVPPMALIPGLEAASVAQLGWLDAPGAPWPAGGHALAVRGIRAQDDFPLWVAVELPRTVPEPSLAVGRLVDEEGVALGTFQRAVEPRPIPGGWLVELSVPVPHAGASLQLALADPDQPIAVRSVRAEPVPPGSDVAYIGPMVAGAEVVEEADAPPGAPFVFGGFHVVPRLDGRYGPDEALSYFCLLAHLGRAEDGELRVAMGLRLYRDGESRPLANTPRQPAEPSAVAPWVHMLGSQLPLAALPGPGAYRLEVSVIDRVTGAERTSVIPFEIAGDGE